MIGIVAYWSCHEWLHLNIGRWTSFYRYTARAYDVDKVVFIGTKPFEWEYSGDLVFEEYNTLEDFLKVYSDTKIVGLTLDATVNPSNLKDYVHPKGDVFYIVGDDYGELEISKLSKYDVDYVKIETNEKMPLWGHIALGIILYDKYVKE